MTAHTPGPWRSVAFRNLTPSANPTMGWRIEADNRGIADLIAIVKTTKQGIELQRANASLIAAAPELAAALRDCIHVLHDHPILLSHQRALAAGEAALRKAGLL